MTQPAVRYQVSKCHLYPADGTYKLEPGDSEVYLASDHDRVVQGLEHDRNEFKRLNEHHKEQFLTVNLTNTRLRGLLQRVVVEYTGDEMDKVRGALLSQVEDALRVREGGA